jgi:hypothetical protein
VWGRIGLGLKAYDRMDETSNTYGVKEVVLTVDGDTVYQAVVDRFSFDNSRYINSYADWWDWTENRSWYMKSFVEPGNRLSLSRLSGNGLITIDQERLYDLEYIVKDAHGNINRRKFRLQGTPMSVVAEKPAGVHFVHNQYNHYVGQGVALHVPAGNLYTDCYVNVIASEGGSPFAPLYAVGEPTPLHDYCPLTLNIPNDTFPDKSKYGIVHRRGKNTNWIGGKYTDGKISANIRELGNFTVEIDTVAPRILPLRKEQWTANRRIAFKISDALSGIQSYRGTLDGRFALFEYDAKNDLLTAKYDPLRMPEGVSRLQLIATDAAGNRSEYSAEVSF